jgi:SAM-dependent methyltransferase
MKPLRTPQIDADAPSTQGFYQTHSNDYFKSTVSANVDTLYGPFLNQLPPKATILDAGCGSGRDTKAFLKRGYYVSAIDASSRMAELATAYTGQQCSVLSFQEMTFRNQFDGIWACASLLHVPKREMEDVIRRFIDALKPGGVLYVSLKEGEGERIAEDGRLFNYYTAESFRKVLAAFPTVREVASWTTEEIRSSQHRGPWLNVLLKKSASLADSRKKG